MGFKKGEPRPTNAGRRRGTPNRRTVYVREVLEGAAQGIGGMDRLIAWIKKSPENEYAFWTSMYMKLLPVHVQGAGQRGEPVVEIRREDLARKLEERGLPPQVFGVDVPVLDLSLPRAASGNVDGAQPMPVAQSLTRNTRPWSPRKATIMMTLSVRLSRRTSVQCHRGVTFLAYRHRPALSATISRTLTKRLNDGAALHHQSGDLNPKLLGAARPAWLHGSEPWGRRQHQTGSPSRERRSWSAS